MGRGRACRLDARTALGALTSDAHRGAQRATARSTTKRARLRVAAGNPNGRVAPGNQPISTVTQRPRGCGWGVRVCVFDVCVFVVLCANVWCWKKRGRRRGYVRWCHNVTLSRHHGFPVCALLQPPPCSAPQPTTRGGGSTAAAARRHMTVVVVVVACALPAASSSATGDTDYCYKYLAPRLPYSTRLGCRAGSSQRTQLLQWRASGGAP